MLVVCDASPLRYLILIGLGDCLPVLFRRILVPPAVLAELTRPRTPAAVRDWLVDRPTWLEESTPGAPIEADGLGLGEREAIALAVEARADAVLMDDRDAVKEARDRGLRVLGTLAVLDEAAYHGLIVDLADALDRLARTTNFRVGATVEAIMRDMLRRDRERRATTESDPPGAIAP
ncbi:hypothetical protein [Paludisphaera sp.]|uniref:hypothetical protein n=1 Tax=Paludisphaera sp. TaxID=2017432 RepID=UPI00301D8BFF